MATATKKKKYRRLYKKRNILNSFFGTLNRTLFSYIDDTSSNANKIKKKFLKTTPQKTPKNGVRL